MEKFVGDISAFNGLDITVDECKNTKKTIVVSIEHGDKVYGEVIDASAGFLISCDLNEMYTSMTAVCSEELIMETALELFQKLSLGSQREVITALIGRM